MNFRVDLILEEEQRSASVISFKLVLRLIAIVVPSLLLLVILWNIITFIPLRSKGKNAEQALLIFDKKKKGKLEDMPKNPSPIVADTYKLIKGVDEVTTLRKNVNINDSILRELEGWKKTHVNWNEHLSALQKIFPPELQLTTLMLGHSIQMGQRQDVNRQFTLLLNGNASGVNAEVYVQRLRKSITKTGPFTNILDEVEIKQFDQDPKNSNNRLFIIECKYQPRFF